MRKLNNKGISFTYQEIERDKQGYAKPIDFSKQTEDIVVLAHQPGLGKTYTVLEFMKNHPDSIYLTNRHDIIKENVKNWKKNTYAHWMGFNRICKNKTLKNIHETYHINPSILCSSCSNKKCSYRWQFTKRQRVFAPYEYLSLGQILNNLPDYLFLDEQKLTVDTLTFNHKATIDWLNKIQTHSAMPNTYITHMKNKNNQFFLTKGFKDIQTIYYSDALKNAYQSKKMNDIQTITNINPYLLEKYFKMADSYNDYTRKEYYFPLCYNAFDVLNKMQKQTKLIFMDASFNYKLFRYFLEAFNGEIGFNNPVSIRIYYSNVTKADTNTTVYSMRLSDKYSSWLPKASFKNIKSMLNWLPYHLQKIKEIYGEENVGIITFKKIAKSGYIKLLGYDIQHFGGLRSSNSFKDKKVVIVLGTYFESQDDIFEYLEKIFDLHDKKIIIEELETEKIMTKLMADVGIISKQKKPTSYGKILKPKKRRRFSGNQDIIYDNSWYLEGYKIPKQVSAKDMEDVIKYRIYPVEWIQQIIWDEEMYQAFHRSRGLLNDRIIFAYCWFPPDILNEFKVEAIKRDKDEEEKLWKKLEKQEEKRILHKSFIREMDELVSKNQITLQDIQDAINNPKKHRLGIITPLAKKYKIYNKKDRDAIKQLMYGYYKTKESVKK